MKKILLATTVLAMSATVAAAEVTLSGDARMGIVNDGNDTAFNSRARVTFTMSGETDGGLAFGASFRADNAGAAAGGTAGSVFISGAFGKLSMGDVDSAAKASVGNVAGVGYVGNMDMNEISYLGNLVDEAVLYSYSSGALSFNLSIDQLQATNDNSVVSVGAAYTAGDMTLSVGYESAENVVVVVNPWTVGFANTADATAADNEAVQDASNVVLGVNYTMGNIALAARYAKADFSTVGGGMDADLTQVAASVTYTQDAIGVTAFVRNQSGEVLGVKWHDTTSYGLGATYDLGGGATLAGGVASWNSDDCCNGGNDTVYDLGLTFKF